MRKLFSFFVALLATTCLWAHDFEVDGIYYNILADKTNEVEVTYLGSKRDTYSNEYTGSVTIPATITYKSTIYSVTSIGEGAFSGCNKLASVTISNSVTSIGVSAFSGCSGLTSITIPNSVTRIEDFAFSSCSGLASVTIPNSVTSIGDYAFSYCSGLTSVTIPNSVTYIGERAFYNCTSLSCATIGNSVTTIGRYAFDGCSSLISITIPNSVANIGSYAFNDCSSLTSVLWNSKNCSDYEKGEYSPFGDISRNITSFVFGDSVEHIPAYLCYYMDYLTSLTIPNSVTSIGDYAFEFCRALTSITIPNSVTSIGKGAFFSCSGLTSVTIPNSVTRIEDSAFRYCSGLASVTIPNSVTSIGKAAFSICSGLTSITIPNSVTSIGDYAFEDCSGLTSVTIGNSVTIIGKAAFSGCSGLKSMESLTEVPPTLGDNAFENVSQSIPVYVPCEKVATYKATTGWKSFRNIQVLKYSIVVDENNNLMGTAMGDTTINYLDYVTISAEANYGYHFSHWNDYNNDNPRRVQVTENKTYTAYFDKNTYYITKNYNSEQGYVNGVSSGEYLDNITLKAEPNYGYHFVRWADGNIDNPRTLLLTQDTFLTAEFSANQYSITTTSSDSERGITQGDTTINYLEIVTISAEANYGYHFAQWNDGNTNNPRMVQVIEDKTYTAHFEKNTYGVSVDYNNVYGTVAGPTSGEYMDEITLTAIPNCGYHFTQWGDGNTDNPRSLVLTQDTTFTADFAQSFSGQCGDDLYWSYDETTKTLSITGSGDMYDYTSSTQPWLLFQEQITEVTTSNTTSSIGTSAFEGCVRLAKVSLGYGIENIAANAFAGCKRLYDIYNYATYPPFAEESSFANYNVYVYIPCEYQRDYTLDVVWGKFKFIECLESAETTTDGNVTVVPGYNDITITWPTADNADNYTIVIEKEGEVVCTLTFNADGQLLNIAFAPGRNGNRLAQYAGQAVNGYRFTITGLTEATRYTYSVTTKDAANKTIATYSGEFTTKSGITTSVEDILHSTTNCQKLFRDGQLIIIRDGKTYNAMGQEM